MGDSTAPERGQDGHDKAVEPVTWQQSGSSFSPCWCGTAPGLGHEFEISGTVDAWFLLSLESAGIDDQAIYDAIENGTVWDDEMGEEADPTEAHLLIPDTEATMQVLHQSPEEAMREAERVARLLLERQASSTA